MRVVNGMGITHDSTAIDEPLKPAFIKRMPFYRFVSLFDARGDGFLAGEFPNGITTNDGVPVSATVRALTRGENGRSADSVFGGEVVSNADGTWVIAGLNAQIPFDVVGRLAGKNDVVTANVLPVPTVQLSKKIVHAYVYTEVNEPLLLKRDYGMLSLTHDALSLPSGFSLTGTQLVAPNVESAEGDYPVMLTFTNSQGQNSTQELIIRVLAQPLMLSVSDYGSATVGEAIAPIALSVTGGRAPYSLSVLSGLLPDGLAFDAMSGVISGTPTTEQVMTVVFQAQDAMGRKAQQELVLAVIGAHAFWRVNVTQVYGHCCILEMEWAAEAGGPTLCAGGTALSSGNYNTADFHQDFSFDGVLNNYKHWASNVSTSGWLGYQFSAPVRPKELRLGGINVRAVQYIQNFDVQYSDNGTSWVTVKSYKNENNWPNLTLRPFLV